MTYNEIFYVWYYWRKLGAPFERLSDTGGLWRIIRCGCLIFRRIGSLGYDVEAATHQGVESRLR